MMYLLYSLTARRGQALDHVKTVGQAVEEQGVVVVIKTQTEAVQQVPPIHCLLLALEVPPMPHLGVL